jgi:HlyD family secretion protein
MKNILFFIGLITLLYSCSDNKNTSDAYGNFEATEYTISAETPGKLLVFNAGEGQTLDSGVTVGVIDTVQLHLNRLQLEAQRSAIRSKFSNIVAQIDVLNEQKKVAMVDKDRIEKMFQAKAATQKQLDDVNGRIAVIEKQMLPIESQNSGIVSDVKSIDAQIARIDDQVRRSIIINPVRGTVLNKYAEQYELVAQGKPLYKIADLDNMILRVYVSGEQLPNVRLGGNVRVLVDKNASENRQLTGTISWVSPKAEFTPKIIQTKDERVNMVYAVKVAVKNDGTLKIGMPGEIRFK